MVDCSTIADSYSKHADLYIEVCGALEHVAPDDLAFIERHLGDTDGTVFDVGCGPGHLTAYLADIGCTTAGIDLVAEFVDSARTHWPALDFSVGSMDHLNVPDGSLGGILAWYSPIHREPDDVAPVLAEFRRALAPGGTVVVGFFEGDAVEPFDHKVVTAYRRPIDDMVHQLARAGFTEIERVRRPADGAIRAHAAVAARAVERSGRTQS